MRLEICMLRPLHDTYPAFTEFSGDLLVPDRGPDHVGGIVRLGFAARRTIRRSNAIYRQLPSRLTPSLFCSMS